MQFNTKLIFDICSSAIYVGLIVLINRLAEKITQKKTNPFIIAMIFFFTWFFIPFFGQSVLWMSGSANYLWMSVIYLGFILFNLSWRKLNIGNVLGTIVLGFLTGASNENSGPAAVLIVLLFMIGRFVKERKVSLVSVIGVVFSAVGFLLMMASPGSQKRGTMKYSSEVIQHNLQEIFKISYGDLKWAYLILIILLIAVIAFRKMNLEQFFAVTFFFIGHLAAIYVMAFSPEHPERTFFGGVMFLGVAIFIPAYLLLSESKLIVPILSVACALGFAFSFNTAYQDISVSYHQTQAQYQAIKKAQHQTPKNATVKILTPQHSKYNPTNGVIGLAEQPDQIMNRWESKFFDVNQISGHF